jgi:succinylglutamic semialdehyde dehydrogenase
VSTFESRDPATGEVLWRDAAASAADVNAAMAEARRALPQWSHQPFAEREALVRRFGAELETHREALAEVIARETGKPLWDTRG